MGVGAGVGVGVGACVGVGVGGCARRTTLAHLGTPLQPNVVHMVRERGYVRCSHDCSADVPLGLHCGIYRQLVHDWRGVSADMSRHLAHKNGLHV